MKEAFLNLDKEKQERIINAGFKVFSKHRYKQTSTNELVKEAEISKGMLFYYFGSKETMFHDLIAQGLKTTKTMYVDKIDIEEKDFIERLKKASIAKWQMTQQYPDMVRFISHVVMYEPELLTEAELKLIEALKSEGYHALYQDIDMTQFRDDIPKEKMILLIEDLLAGYEQRIRLSITEEIIASNNYDALYQEFEEYMKIIKQLIYNGGATHD